MPKKILRWAANIITAFILVIGLAAIFSIIQVKNNPGQLPEILGHKVMTIMTGSMEPMLVPGDLLIIKKEEPRSIHPNDVITFRNSENMIVTHRVIDVSKKGEHLYFETKGDANNIKDENLIAAAEVIGVHQFHIPMAGLALDFIKTPIGIALVFLLSAMLLFAGKLKGALLLKEV
jgi:signal peptidase I